MAVTKTILKLTELDAVVKVAGTDAAGTISLDVDLLAGTQVTSGSTQTAVISGLQWTGATNGVITITRNNVVVATLQANAAGSLEMNGQSMIPDTIGSTYPIVVTISGAQAECWLRIKKLSGYASKIETNTYGSYDDPTIVGAVDLNNGSPGYTP